MNDDSKKAHDLFGLSDINKIQADIERDLAESTVFRVPMPETTTNLVDGAEIVSGGETPADSTLTTTNFLMVDPPVTPDPLPADVSAGFYREMIKDPPRRPSGSWLKTAIVVLLICTLGTGTLGFGMGAGWSFIRGNSDNSTNGEARASGSEAMSLTSTSYIFETIVSETEIGTVADIVELLVPSVVGITTRRDEDRLRVINPSPPASSVGSGIIFAECEERIFIATNYYVVRWGSRFEVSIAGNEPIYARPVGGDRYMEVAVLSIYKSQLVAAGISTIAIAYFGDSDEMRFGDAVFALGNAMGDGTSVTAGVISAPQRAMELPGRPHPLMILQTDAAINYGNSGGPLINARGEIIGINISQASGSIFGSSPVEGMGYSIASNMVAPILDAIVSAPPAAGIGIRGITINDDEAARLGVLALGVLVSEVTEGLGAYHAGMLPDDVITGFNGSPIFEMEQLQVAIRSGNIGDIVEVRVIRNSTDAITLRIELGRLVVEFN